MSDEYTEALEAGLAAGMVALTSNPVIKLQTLTQAASNLANVARVAHEIGYEIGKNALNNPDVMGRVDKCLALRDTAIDRMIALVDQIKDK